MSELLGNLLVKASRLEEALVIGGHPLMRPEQLGNNNRLAVLNSRSLLDKILKVVFTDEYKNSPEKT